MPVTPNMDLQLPIVGTTLGPQWAVANNVAFTTIDLHNHTSGFGVQVPSAGLNINQPLSLNGQNLFDVGFFTFNGTGPVSVNQSVATNGIDLFYTDGNGTQIQLTASGGIAGTNGSISGLVAPASASYNATTGFTWLKNSTTPSAMVFGTAVQSLTSTGFTVSTTNSASQSASYVLTLPIALPSASPFPNSFLMVSSTGVEAYGQVDNSTLTQLSPRIIGVKTQGITAVQIADGTIQTGNIALGQITQPLLAPIQFEQTGTLTTPVTSLTAPGADCGTITLSPQSTRGIYIGLNSDGSSGGSTFRFRAPTVSVLTQYEVLIQTFVHDMTTSTDIGFIGQQRMGGYILPGNSTGVAATMASAYNTIITGLTVGNSYAFTIFCFFTVNGDASLNFFDMNNYTVWGWEI